MVDKQPYPVHVWYILFFQSLKNELFEKTVPRKRKKEKKKKKKRDFKKLHFKKV
jgi:hypothetical protein